LADLHHKFITEENAASPGHRGKSLCGRVYVPRAPGGNENPQQKVQNAQVDCVSCSVSTVGEFCCAWGMYSSAEHADLGKVLSPKG
jgi:hypothetical protein